MRNLVQAGLADGIAHDAHVGRDAPRLARGGGAVRRLAADRRLSPAA